MDILLEIFLEIYGELMMLIISEGKKQKKWLVTLLAIANFAGALALFLWGVVLLTENGNALGWIPIFFSVILSGVQIGFGVCRFVRGCRKKKQ